MPSQPLNKVYHVLNVPEKEQAFIKEVVEDLQETYIKGKALRAAGEAAEGILSNPNLSLLVGGGILAVVSGYLGADKIDGVIKYFQSFQTLLTSEDTTAKSIAANQMVDFLKGIIPFGFLVD